MNVLTAKDAKYGFGGLIDLARVFIAIERVVIRTQ
jgi:hypothetical protein